MKRYFIGFVAILLYLILVGLMTGCYYDNAEDMYPWLSNVNCDAPQSVSFSSDVLPVMNQNCNNSGCHNGIDRTGQIVLDNFSDLSVTALNGSLLGSIQHSPSYLPMPDGQAQLDNCTITLIATWIDQGALNN